MSHADGSGLAAGSAAQPPASDDAKSSQSMSGVGSCNILSARRVRAARHRLMHYSFRVWKDAVVYDLVPSQSDAIKLPGTALFTRISLLLELKSRIERAVMKLALAAWVRYHLAPHRRMEAPLETQTCGFTHKHHIISVIEASSAAQSLASDDAAASSASKDGK